MPTLKLPSLKRYLIWLVQNIEMVKNRRVWSFDDRLSDLEIMTVLLEDRRYFLHFGIDPKSLVRAAIGLFTGRKSGGGSTIEMQLVRTITGLREPSFRRKINELAMGAILSFHMSKGGILRTYMDVAYYGTGLTGISAASRKTFGKRPDQLGFDEAALLAAMLVYPMPKVPNSTWYSKVNTRADYGKRLYTRHKERFKNLRVAD